MRTRGSVIAKHCQAELLLLVYDVHPVEDDIVLIESSPLAVGVKIAILEDDVDEIATFETVRHTSVPVVRVEGEDIARHALARVARGDDRVISPASRPLWPWQFDLHRTSSHRLSFGQRTPRDRT